MCGAGHCGPVGLPPLTCPRRGLSSLMLVERWIWGGGCQAGWRTPRRTPSFSSLREGPLKHPQLAVGRAKPLVAWRVSGSPSPPFCTRVCGQEEEGRQQECRNPGQALSQQAGVRRLFSPPCPSLSSLCKQQRHTGSPCVRAHVCARAGGLGAQGTRRLKLAAL